MKRTTNLAASATTVATLLCLTLVACSGSGAGPIAPGPDAQRLIQEAMIGAQEGGTIELAAGRFVLDATLSLDVSGVTLQGQGADETVLDFSGQAPGTGGEGILVTGNDFVVADLAVENTRADGIKVEGTSNATFRDIRVEWTGGPSTENGAYGIYPVQVDGVLIEGSKVRGASDAGIYVGQSQNIIVRNNEAWENVAGIEVENSTNAEVYGNVAHGNTGGLLVFSLPELPVKAGRDVRVHDNKLVDNNLPNFGKPGAIVSEIPAGSGLILMASDNVDVFNNDFENNDNANIAIISYLSTGRPFEDPEFDPFTEGISIRENRFVGGGQAPQGAFAEAFAPALGGTFPDIVWDGVVDPAKLVDGEVPEDLRVYIHDNGDASFVNLDAGAALRGDEPQPVTDITLYGGELPSPPGPVTLAAGGM